MLNWRDKALMVLACLLIGTISNVYSLKYCTDTPLTNSTIMANDQVMFSNQFWIGIREIDRLCSVDLFNNEKNFTMFGWGNEFQLKNCYWFDDPVFITEGENLVNGKFLDSSTYCRCHNVGRDMGSCDPNYCSGVSTCVSGFHNSESCSFVATGTWNLAIRQDCLAGFKRFIACEISEENNFDMAMQLRMTNQTFISSMSGDIGQINFDNGDKVNYQVLPDKDMIGKYVIIDSKIKENFWIIDKEYVNSIDEQDIDKIGWFKYGQKQGENKILSEQFSIKVKNCDKNEIDLVGDYMITSTFLDSHPEMKAHKRNGAAYIRMSDDTIYTSKGEGITSSFNGEFFTLKYGFFTQVGSTVIINGIPEENNNLPINYKGNLMNVTGSNWRSTCTTPQMTYAESLELHQNKEFVLWMNAYLDYNGKLCNDWWGVSADGCFSYRHFVQEEGDRFYEPYNENFKVLLWPSNDVYEYKMNSVTGMPEQVRKYESQVQPTKITFSQDETRVFLNIKSFEPLKTEIINYPTINDIVVTCKSGDCYIEISKNLDDSVVVSFSDCFNDIIYSTQPVKLNTEQNCDMYVTAKVTKLSTKLYEEIIQVNATGTAKVTFSSYHYNGENTNTSTNNSKGLIDFLKTVFGVKVGTWLANNIWVFILVTTLLGLTIIAIISMFFKPIRKFLYYITIWPAKWVFNKIYYRGLKDKLTMKPTLKKYKTN